MKQKLIKSIQYLRAEIMRVLLPGSLYYLGVRSLQPLSRKFGFDRGTPIDRFWIEAYLHENKQNIKGNVLEIGDRRYTTLFGKGVTNSDVLDITKHAETTIVADLTDASIIKENTYDCIILTHVLGIIPNYQKAIEECYRILKKDGVLLVTVACFSPVQDHSQSLWRFTPIGLEYVVGNIFGKSNTNVKSYGNVLAGQCFWVGMSQEELSQEELSYSDPEYPCIATCRAVKQ